MAEMEQRLTALEDRNRYLEDMVYDLAVHIAVNQNKSDAHFGTRADQSISELAVEHEKAKRAVNPAASTADRKWFRDLVWNIKTGAINPPTDGWR